jgi:hypothetical protein
MVNPHLAELPIRIIAYGHTVIGHHLLWSTHGAVVTIRANQQGVDTGGFFEQIQAMVDALIQEAMRGDLDTDQRLVG